MIFVPGACPVVSPPRNGLWYTPHAASVHTPAAPPCPVRNAARPELSDLRTGLPGLDRPGPPPDCHPGETLEDGVRTGLAGGPRVLRRDPVVGDQRHAPVREDPLPCQLLRHAAPGRVLRPVRRAVRRNPGRAHGRAGPAPALDRRGPVGHAGMAARLPLLRLPLGAARLQPIPRPVAHSDRRRDRRLRRLVPPRARERRSEEHTSELQSLAYLVCRLLLEKKKNQRHWTLAPKMPHPSST